MTFEALGWNDRFRTALSQLQDRELTPARVAREDRGSYVVYEPGRALRAVLRGKLRHEAVSRSDLPAVGDWVAIRRNATATAGPAVIEAVLPRSSAITRRASGPDDIEQVLAANVETLLICCGLDGDFNLRRIERFLTLAWGSGAAPAVVLTKADLCANVSECVAEVESVAIGAPVIAIGLDDDAGVQAVRQLVPLGQTAALVGSSGVGKSTLINRLLQRNAMQTGAVRANDQRGRHTTTYRQLLLLPDAGVVIDTPGLREVQLWADASDLGSSFADIEELAANCRFRDCTHNAEPGCNVLAAIENGDLDAERLESFRKLERELAYQERRTDRAAAAAETAKWKAIHKSARKWMKEKYRY